MEGITIIRSPTALSEPGAVSATDYPKFQQAIAPEFRLVILAMRSKDGGDIPRP